MAYLPQSQMEKDREKEQLENSSSTSEKVLSGGTGAISGSSGSGATGGGAKASSFVNIQDYLKANEGDNATKIGQAAAGTVSKATNEAKSAATGTADSFTERAKAATVHDDAGLRSSLTSNIAGTLGDANKAKTITDKRNATYTGPDTQTFSQTFGDATTSKVTRAHELGNMARDPGSTRTLLQETFKQEAPRYSGKLDHALLRMSDSGKAALQNVKDIDKNLDADVMTARTAGTQAIDSARTTTDQTAQTWRDTLGSLQGQAKGWHDTAADTVGKLNTGIDAEEQRALGDLRSPQKRVAALANLIKMSAPNTSDSDALAQAQYAVSDSSFDPSKLVSATGQRYSVGDKMDSKQTTDYNALRSYLGDDSLAAVAPAALGGKTASAIRRDDNVIAQLAGSAQEGLDAKALQEYTAASTRDYGTLAPLAGVGSFVAPSADEYTAAFDTLKRYGVNDADIEFLKTNPNIYKYVKQGPQLTAADMRAGKKPGPGLLVDTSKVATDAAAWRAAQAKAAADAEQARQALIDATRMSTAGSTMGANATNSAVTAPRPAPAKPAPIIFSGIEGLFGPGGWE